MPSDFEAATVHDYLDELRAKYGNDRAVCDVIGLQSAYISQIRKGRALPSDETFARMCIALGLSDEETDRAFLRLAFWRDAQSPRAAAIWRRIAARVPMLAFPLLFLLALNSAARADAARKPIASPTVYYEKRRRWRFRSYASSHPASAHHIAA